ncbi:hypothetical protein HPB52_002340 [Rhipicephalus sanguineus]|uniref:CCHC-type domain-containing protein n=1 Tax=Rhipicephalus sanguineus TaxID=34632 RepID=A0A9D4QBU9_RHISA|nr:hypothetical protein HPB52_002340 [Rhipicephalus sanguineus]
MEGAAVVMEGDDLPPEDFGEEHGWRSAAVKKHSRRTDASATERATTCGDAGGYFNAIRKDLNLNKVIKSSRMPRLPSEHWKIIVRPRGGLDVQQTGSARLGRAIAVAAGIAPELAGQDVVCPNTMQNIIVISTASRANADSYLRMRCLTLGIKQYEINTYEAAPHATLKRIKNSETVVIVFDGYKVPNFVYFGTALVRCSLYHRQHDCCYACGRLGHRADVCPTPDEVVCKQCGISNPGENHTCSPKCGLCGGPHATTDKSCKQRFQLPFIVRWRRRERRAESERRSQPSEPASADVGLTQHAEAQADDCDSSQRPRSPSRSSARSRSRSRGRKDGGSSEGRPRSRSKSRRRSKSRGRSLSRSRTGDPQGKVHFQGESEPALQGGTWADRVRSGGRPGGKVTGGTAPEQGLEELNQLRKENAEMRSIIESLRAEMAELRRTSKSQPTPSSASQLSGSPSPQPTEVPMVVEAGPSGNPAKRKAVSSSAENVQAKAKSEIKETLNSICLEIQRLNERLSVMDHQRPIPPYTLVCTYGAGIKAASAFPEDGFCDFTVLEEMPSSVPQDFAEPFPPGVQHFVDTAAKYRKTEFVAAFDFRRASSGRFCTRQIRREAIENPRHSVRQKFRDIALRRHNTTSD